ncbi:MAG TPA: tripartite tricarboxylate transporter substrate binding protein [Xanthobacteraceae bacterium]|nr:tripartite tricarboxylate transporter substrate binding protein [Xanthobacteraceae bacterium]
MRLSTISSCLLALALTGSCLSAPARAETQYPDKPVRIILPYGPGGVADVTNRLVAQKLSERLGQNFIIDNRPGAGGIIAAKATLAAPSDGYTLFSSGNGAAINESLFKNLPFSLMKDFTPISMLAEFEMLLVTKGDSELDTVAKVVAYAKEHPGKLNFGAINVGSTQNLSAELFRMVTGANVTLVTYRTTPELVTAIVRGDVNVGFDYLAALRPMITGKQIKVIATSGAHPNPQLPGVPIVKDSGYPDYVVTSWNAISGPGKISQDIVDKLNGEIQAVLKLPDIKERMAALGMEPMMGTPEDMKERLAHDIEKWRVVIEKAGIPKH